MVKFRYLICQTIGVSTSIFKPIIYGLSNKALREMYLDTVRQVFCPFGLCARPQRNHIRRLIRIGLGRSMSELPVEDDGIALYESEVFTHSSRRQQLYRTRKYQSVEATTGSSLMDRRLVHSDKKLRRGHYSLR